MTALIGFACSSAGTADQSEASVEALHDELALFTPGHEQHYFTIQRDLRRCIAPLCGGYFITAVNAPFTVCADGYKRDRCYVAEIDFSAVPDANTQGATIVVEGSLREKMFENFGSFGVLVARGAWGSATDAVPTGAYYRLKDNGVRCSTTPCFSVDAELLNLDFVVPLSGVDLRRVGATAAQVKSASNALAQGNLLATGRKRLVLSQREIQLELVASQFFLPGAIAHECASDADCAGGAWCRPTQEGGTACAPFVGEGSRCEGFTLPWAFERCAPELVCDTPPFIADVPGVCRTACKTSADCKPEQYCASDNVCHEDATCDLNIDCNLEGNSYLHILCLGYGTCLEDNRCGFRCGDPKCVDLFGADFGPCDAVLGWGVEQGVCKLISGCSSNGFNLFATEAECTAACSPR